MPNGSGSNRCSPPQNPSAADRPMTTAASSTGCCGSCAPAPPGGIYRLAMAPGARWLVASTVGGKPASSSTSWPLSSSRPRPRASSIGRSTPSIAPSSGPTSMPRGQKRGPGERSLRPQSGRLQYQEPPPRRRPGQAHAVAPDAWPTP
jgi:hypothetical protein